MSLTLMHVPQVISTFQVAAELGSQSLGAYVISMAKNASDVLAVELLQKEAHLTVGGTRFISSKSSSQLSADAQASAGAAANGNASAATPAASGVHSSKSSKSLQPTKSDASTVSGAVLSGAALATLMVQSWLHICSALCNA